MNDKLPDVYCPHCRVLVALEGIRTNHCTARGCGKKLTDPVTAFNCRLKLPEQMVLPYRT